MGPSFKSSLGSHTVAWTAVLLVLALSLLNGYLASPGTRSGKTTRDLDPTLSMNRDAGRENGYKDTGYKDTVGAARPVDVPVEQPCPGAGGSKVSSAVLTWDAPQTNADGTPLKDLAGFRVHYGRERGKYTDVVDVGRSTTCSLQSLPCGRFYFAVTAYDTSGNESKPSNEVWKDVQ